MGSAVEGAIVKAAEVEDGRVVWRRSDSDLVRGSAAFGGDCVEGFLPPYGDLSLSLRGEPSGRLDDP